LLILDFVEFVWANVGKPMKMEYHSYHRHHHLRFDIEEGQAVFCDDVNRLFSRNGVAYELTAAGQIRRILPETLGDMIARSRFETGDQLLDGMLEENRAKFSDPDPLIRREGLERLWDGWERLKTLSGNDKKKSIAMILDVAATGESDLRQLLEDQANTLTSVGNTKLNRHFEKTQKPVFDTDHVDYFYFRLLALVTLLIIKNAPPYQAHR
jgi:AbiJ N-terminal domain 4